MLAVQQQQQPQQQPRSSSSSVKFTPPARGTYKQFMPNPPAMPISANAALLAVRFVANRFLSVLKARKQRARAGTRIVVKSGPIYAHDRRFYCYSLTPREVRDGIELALQHPKPDEDTQKITDILCYLADDAHDLCDLMARYDAEVSVVKKAVKMFKRANHLVKVKTPEQRTDAQDWLNDNFPNTGTWYATWRAQQVYIGLIAPNNPPEEDDEAQERREECERAAARAAARARAQQSPAFLWMDKLLASKHARGSWPTHSYFTGLSFRAREESAMSHYEKLQDQTAMADEIDETQDLDSSSLIDDDERVHVHSDAASSGKRKRV